MFNGENDKVTKLELSNPFNNETSTVNMNNQIFMPYIDIGRQSFELRDDYFDIWEDNRRGE